MALKVDLGYRDAAAAISFLVDALGFEQVAVYTGATSDVIAHDELRGPEHRHSTSQTGAQ